MRSTSSNPSYNSKYIVRYMIYALSRVVFYLVNRKGTIKHIRIGGPYSYTCRQFI